MPCRLSADDCLRIKSLAEKMVKDFPNKRGVICTVNLYWQFMHGRYYDSKSCSDSNCKCSVEDYHSFVICLVDVYRIGMTMKFSNLTQTVNNKTLKTFSKKDKEIYKYIQETKDNPKFLDSLEHKYGFNGINGYIRNFKYTRIYEIIITQIPFLDVNYKNRYKINFEQKFASMIVNHLIYKNIFTHISIMKLYEQFLDFTNDLYKNGLEHFCLQLFKMNIPIIYRNDSLKDHYFAVKADEPIKEAINKYSLEYVVITKMFPLKQLFQYICAIYEINVDHLKHRFKKDIELIQEFQKSVKKEN